MAAPVLSDKPGDEPSKPLLVLLQEGRVPEPLISKLTEAFEEIEDFAFAMPRLEDLDPWLGRIPQETLQALQIPDSATLTTSQPAARLRMSSSLTSHPQSLAGLLPSKPRPTPSRTPGWNMSLLSSHKSGLTSSRNASPSTTRGKSSPRTLCHLFAFSALSRRSQNPPYLGSLTVPPLRQTVPRNPRSQIPQAAPLRDADPDPRRR